MPSSKIPKRNSRSRVSKMGVNPYEIVGIRLDETNKQVLMHEHVDKHAKMKKKKPNGWHKTSNVSISSHRAEKGFESSKPPSRGCVLTSGYTQISHKKDGCNHTRASPRGAPSMAKPRAREASMDTKHRSKQA